jgi:hypothetical protein
MGSSSDIFEPDLIVTSDDGTEMDLVVDARPSSTHLAEVEGQLKEYMLAMRSPLGLLATPHTIRLYHDEYLPTDDESIKVVGEYPAPVDWAAWEGRPDSARAGLGFEDVVQNWLERLATESGLRSLPADFRRAVEEYLWPVLNRGVVRAARPWSS